MWIHIGSNYKKGIMFEQLTTFSDIFKDFLVHPEKNYVIRQSDLQYFYDLKKVMDL